MSKKTNAARRRKNERDSLLDYERDDDDIDDDDDHDQSEKSEGFTWCSSCGKAHLGTICPKRKK